MRDADNLHEVDLGGEQTVLVLARNAYLIREQIEPALVAQGIVYERNGRSSLNMKALSAAESWTRLGRGQAITVSDARVMYEYLKEKTGRKRGFKELKQFGDEVDRLVTTQDLVDHGGLMMDPSAIWSTALERLPAEDVAYMTAARRRGERLRAAPRVRVSTIHSAKGGEADHVVLFREMAKRTHREMEEKPEDEARVWYVAVTRAKNDITLIAPETAQSCPWI